jgi:thymidylate kinase
MRAISPKPLRRTPIITLMGPDGVGKTTHAEYLEAHPGIPGVAGVMTIHRKVTLEPNSPPEKVPANLPPHNLFKSVAKLVFRYFEWLYVYYFGEVAQARSRGFIVACDRFYFLDMLIDPLRYRYGGPSWLVALALKLSPGPDLVFLLDAPAEMLYSRKKEASLDEIEKWRQIYRSRLLQLPNAHLIDVSGTIEEAGEQIRKFIREYVAK